MKHCHLDLFHSADDGGWIGGVPDLELCSAFRETPEQALGEVRDAMTAWLATARKLRKRILKPAYRPAIDQLVAT